MDDYLDAVFFALTLLAMIAGMAGGVIGAVLLVEFGYPALAGLAIAGGITAFVLGIARLATW